MNTTVILYNEDGVEVYRNGIIVFDGIDDQISAKNLYDILKSITNNREDEYTELQYKPGAAWQEVK